MKASSVIFGAAVLLATTLLAMADAESPATSRQLRKGGRGGKKAGDRKKDEGCADPVQAVMDLLECVAHEDGECAAAAYDPGFERWHNEKRTEEIPVDTAEFWTGAFSVVDLSFEIMFTSNPSKNKASVRYVEKVVTDDGTTFGLPASTNYPFDSTIIQHEHALVDVDDDCKIKKWDQYGDNAEQTDVDIVVADLLCAVDSENCSDP